MNQDLVAQTIMKINAPITKVWDALINPYIIKQYMFGAWVVSDWNPGSPIYWRGEFEGKPYEDKGEILHIDTYKKLQYSHYSSQSKLPDLPENYHILTFELSNDGKNSVIRLTQDNNTSKLERDHSKELWEVMLVGLKNLLER